MQTIIILGTTVLALYLIILVIPFMVKWLITALMYLFWIIYKIIEQCCFLVFDLIRYIIISLLKIIEKTLFIIFDLTRDCILLISRFTWSFLVQLFAKKTRSNLNLYPKNESTQSSVTVIKNIQNNQKYPVSYDVGIYKEILLQKVSHLGAKKIARECGLNYYTTRNFLIGRTKFPENNLMEKIDDYCKKVGKELTTPWNCRPDYLRAKMKHLFIQKISDETGFHYMTIRNFVIGFTTNPDPQMLTALENYCLTIGEILEKPISQNISITQASSSLDSNGSFSTEKRQLINSKILKYPKNTEHQKIKSNISFTESISEKGTVAIIKDVTTLKFEDMF